MHRPWAGMACATRFHTPQATPVQHQILRSSHWKKALAVAITLLACLPAWVLAQERNNTRLVIEAFRCQGNETTSCRVILGYVYLAVGDAVNEDEIQNATLRLSQLRTFEHIAIH